jgi:hypothetical protein
MHLAKVASFYGGMDVLAALLLASFIGSKIGELG